MALNLADYKVKTEKAVKAFWQTREQAKQKQKAAGKEDQGERAGVTAGKNMDGFLSLVSDIVRANGLKDAEIHLEQAVLTLPGYFRPTKLWDLLVMHKGELVAAIEFKSQVGPSFGNNFNNRAEEAIGTSLDFWTAYREGAFEKQPRPFVGWFMLVEDHSKSRAPVKGKEPHFRLLKDFEGTSYLERYDILCQKLMLEQLYTSAAILATPRTAIKNGIYSELSTMTGLEMFVTTLAGHIAATSARLCKTV